MSLLNIFVYLIPIALAVGLYVCHRHHRLPLPPGPPGLPLLGNIFDVPKSNEELVYSKWAREYGSDLIYLNMAGTSVIVINSHKAAHDLFETRSAIYSDRASAPMMNELIGFDSNFGLMRYGAAWRERRKVFHQCFHATATLQYRRETARVAKEFLFNTINQLEDGPTEYLRLMAGSSILGLVYGLEVYGKEDPQLQTAENLVIAVIAAGNTGSYLVDFVPLLKHIPAWMPGAKFKRDALRWRKFVMASMEDPYNAVTKKMENNTPNSSITASLLEKVKEDPDRVHLETVIKESMGSAYQAGSHTTAGTLQGFFLAMLLFPNVLKRAQEEVDAVVGNERLPNFDDQESLPYVTAVVKELLRWRPITPLALSHRVMVDDIYTGYRIPAGTIVVGNAWAILHDEDAYPNPERFYPERFLTKEGQLNSDVREPDAAFGFGRRICPGRYLAWELVWITVAMSLSTLKIEKMVDEEGNIVEPTEEYSTGLLRYPLPFKCSIKPRSVEAEAVIRGSIDEMRK